MLMARTAMLSKKKVYVCVLLSGILFFWIALRTIHKIVFPLTPIDTAKGPARYPVTVHHKTFPSSIPTRASNGSCPCPPCVAKFEDLDWYNKRFEPLQKPFLTSENSTIDPKALQWWLALQYSVNALKIDDVVQKMFQVIPSPDINRRSLEKYCQRCAVVGNSGNLLGSGFGPAIDSHSVVIRMNKARTAGFEADVGNKTTHHFMYPESAVDLNPAIHLVLIPFKLRDLQWVASALSTGEIKMTYMRVKERVKADKNKVLVVNPAFFKYVHDNWTEHHGRYPSTGMLAIIFALHTCHEVSVFGYGADSEGNWHHYWEKNLYAGAFRKTGVHSADFEMEVIQQLNKTGKIRLRR